MAAASGLHLVPNGQHDPRITTSCGTGELMLAALAQLVHIDLIGLDPRLRQLSIPSACDVDNPLCGEKGDPEVFGPQKGTMLQMVVQFDAALRHYGELMEQVTGHEIVRQLGTGAAGGMGTALARHARRPAIHGKTPISIARVSKRHGLLVIGIIGSLAADYQVVHHLHGIDDTFSVLDRIVTLEGGADGCGA